MPDFVSPPFPKRSVTSFNTDLNQPISPEEFRANIPDQNNSSPGFDNIIYAMLKKFIDISKKYIMVKVTTIYLQQVKFPMNGKKITIIPILKPHKKTRKSTTLQTYCYHFLLQENIYYQ